MDVVGKLPNSYESILLLDIDVQPGDQLPSSVDSLEDQSNKEKEVSKLIFRILNNTYGTCYPVSSICVIQKILRAKNVAQMVPIR